MAAAFDDPLIRRHVKLALVSDQSSPGRAIEWPDVLRALQSERARSGATSLYRAAGFSADDFAHRRAARLAMVEALVRTEDESELRGNGRPTAERDAIRRVRRALESEVHP